MNGRGRHTSEGPVVLDATDQEIIRRLKADGRLLNAHLAEQLNLPASTCLARTNRLERSGHIQGYRADIDLSRFENMLIVYCDVTLTDRSAPSLSRFEQRMKAIASVIECARVQGDCDYVLKVAAQSISHYQETIGMVFTTQACVDRYFSYFVLRSFVTGGVRNPAGSTAT